jgi:type II secretory pathway pseudopilin PulG
VAKVLILLAITSVLINGCKKDTLPNGSSPLTKQQQIENAKNWYESQQKLSSATIESSKDEKAKLIFNPNWEKAAVENINGITVISTFVNTTLRNFDQGATTFNLVIKFDENGYESKTVTIKNKEQNDMYRLTPFELYDIAFTKNELANDELNAEIKVFSQAFKQEKEEIYDPSGRTEVNFKLAKLNNTPQTNVTVCVDYWLNIDFYSPTGALIESTSTYLGRYCQETDIQVIWWIDNGDGTYGGGNDFTNDEVVWGSTEDESNFEAIDTTELNSQLANAADKAFGWRVYSATGGIAFSAHLRMFVKTQGMVWVIRKLDFEGISNSGNISDSKGWSVTPSSVSWDDVTHWTLAAGTLKFKDNRSKVRLGQTVNVSKQYEKYGSWTRAQVFR